MAAIVTPFWQRKTMQEMTTEEWESLCDGCGLCCLQKLEDEEDGDIYYTNIACKLLDLDSCQCTNYAERKTFVPDCIQLTPAQVDDFKWLPQTCAYRLVAEGKDLPVWHHLVCENTDAVHVERISYSGRMVSELSVAEDDWEQHLIFKSS
ncbi:YcgN family cysteine cluster protein [Thiopseudomonas alkaliphila]|uniref:UPF0260 protein HX099_05855 n=1 Tax=Thiopseudomonas alkaliphila TaxID=1697053 RepID=A0AAW7DPY1_9GAMM|nr:YcgN family cysteine cluster protein [Thiopseudomonas alkaliphila]MDM1696184.1 YcgN family cysteine cluster protein [Thiopseudomonas alkaliphila]